MTASQFSRKPLHALLWSQFAYWCMLGVSIWALLRLHPGDVRSVLVLSPIAPGLLIFAVGYWLYQASDEYIRLRILKAAALTLVVVGLIVFVYSFLEILGLPRMSMIWLHNIGWAVFVAQMLRLTFSLK